MSDSPLPPSSFSNVPPPQATRVPNNNPNRPPPSTVRMPSGQTQQRPPPSGGSGGGPRFIPPNGQQPPQRPPPSARFAPNANGQQPQTLQPRQVPNPNNNNMMTNGSSTRRLSSSDKFQDDNDDEGFARGDTYHSSFNGNNGGVSFGDDVNDQPEKPTPRNWTRMSLPGDHDFDENNASLHLVVNEWAGGTSIHGVASISDFMTWKLWKRMMWLVLVLASAGLMVWQIESLIRQYTNYEVITDTETVIPGNIDFPEITLCNYDRLSEALINDTGIEEPRNETELEMLTPNMEDFIVYASFNDKDIDNITESFKKTITSEGICWSYQANETVLKPGQYGGFYAWLWIDQENYQTNYSDLAGVQVYLQQPGTHINDQLPFVAASPGKETIANIKLIDFVREKELPWARCTGDAPTYTQAFCREKCVNEALRETCSCRKYNDFEDLNMAYCTDDENYDCVVEFVESKEPSLLRDGCQECDLPACTEKRYEANVNTMDYSVKMLELFESWFGLTEESPQEVRDAVREVFKLNLVTVKVNFDKIEYELLTESKAVTFAQLLGSIGGSMGLFLGISALSVFEVFGDLAALRLIPRLFGYRNLYGVGARSSDE